MARNEQEARKKERERRWIEFAWEFRPGLLPVGVLAQPDEPGPDVLIRSSIGEIGIEITQALLCDDEQKFSSVEIKHAQQKILLDAMSYFGVEADNPFFVNVSFSSGDLPKHQLATKELIGAVSRYAPLEGKFFEALPGSRKAKDLLPTWMEGISIFHDGPRAARWVGGSVWTTQGLRQDQLQKIIQRKESRLSGYRACASKVWLLIVCNQVAIAEDISVPSNAKNWTFVHSFDRVILMTPQEAWNY